MKIHVCLYKVIFPSFHIRCLHFKKPLEKKTAKNKILISHELNNFIPYKHELETQSTTLPGPTSKNFNHLNMASNISSQSSLRKQIMA